MLSHGFSCKTRHGEIQLFEYNQWFSCSLCLSEYDRKGFRIIGLDKSYYLCSSCLPDIGINLVCIMDYIYEKQHIWKIASKEWIQWRYHVLNEAGFKCTRCFAEDRLRAHHIKQRLFFPELTFNVDNGICLCLNCHKLFHKRYGNKYIHAEQKINDFRNEYTK